MAREKKSAGFSLRKFLFALVTLVSVFLCLTGMIIAFVLCVDHVSEFFNGWNYKNNWEPFHGSYIDFVKQIPYEVYIAIGWFPEACFITLIFYPMFVFLIALYEVAYGEYTMVMMGWVPFVIGVALFVVVGFMLLGEPKNPNAGKYDKI